MDLPSISIISCTSVSAPAVIPARSIIGVLVVGLRLIPIQFALRTILLKEIRNRLIVLDKDLAQVCTNVFIAIVVERCCETMVANTGSTSYGMCLVMKKSCSRGHVYQFGEYTHRSQGEDRS